MLVNDTASGSAISTQTNTNKPISGGRSTIAVEGYTLEVGVSCRCTEVRRAKITTPRITLLVTATLITRNEEASEERSIADQ